MESVLRDKSYTFALSIIDLYKYIIHNHKEYVLSRQLLKSGTAIGALIREAQYAQSRRDFINKLSVSLKEANEADYWLNLLRDSAYIDDDIYASTRSDVKELIKMLTSSINTMKKNM